MSRVAVVLLLVSEVAVAQVLTGRVVHVTDGDTVTILESDHQQRRIRVAGIDAPEKAQPFGQRAKQNLSALVFGQEVDVVGNKTDRYGRTVAKLMVASPNCDRPSCPRDVDAGLRQIQAGLAWWYRKYAREQTPEDRALYEAEEREARSHRLGLWANPNPIAPWDWRRAERR